jgi:hypothetical protein
VVAQDDIALPRTEVPRPSRAGASEQVLDARVCLLSACPHLLERVGRDGGTRVICGAAIHRAALPLDMLTAEVQRNPDPAAGAGASENPFLLRLLMSADCVLDRCGVTRVQRTDQGHWEAREEGALFTS